MSALNPFSNANNVIDYRTPFQNMTPISADDYAALLQGNADSLAGKIGDWFGEGNSAAAAAAKTRADREYEQRATQSARAWDEYMQSTQYQRAVKDLQAAGLNPWLAVQRANLGGSSQTTAGSGSSARYKSEESKKSGASTAVAALLIAVARIAAAVIAA